MSNSLSKKTSDNKIPEWERHFAKTVHWFDTQSQFCFKARNAVFLQDINYMKPSAWIRLKGMHLDHNFYVVVGTENAKK